MTVREIMTTRVVTVTPDTPVPVIASLLRDSRIGGVPVTDTSGSVIGLVSEYDLLARKGETAGEVAPPPAPVPPPGPSPAGRRPASPLVRKLAREHGIDLTAVPGSGPDGRIYRADIEHAARDHGAALPPPQLAAAPTGPVPPAPIRPPAAVAPQPVPAADAEEELIEEPLAIILRTRQEYFHELSCKN